MIKVKLKEYLQKLFARRLYPVSKRDWYKNKGYMGENSQEKFNNFLLAQTKPNSPLFGEFEFLDITRQFIKSTQFKLDSVIITPNKKISYNKAGYGLIFIMFQGRSEYYESRFRDMARLVKYTGVSVLGFNPKGFHSSSGKTLKISDIVEDGIAVIEFLLKKSFSPNKIILFGNSIGAGISDIVSEHFRNKTKIRFRQINSNSFKSLASVIASKYGLSFLENILSKVMLFAGWEISPSKDFYKTGPYRCFIRRQYDRTILANAEYYKTINYELDYKEAPDNYKQSMQWLYENNQLIYLGKSKEDPHELSLYNFRLKAKDKTGKNLTVFDLITYYLEATSFLN